MTQAGSDAVTGEPPTGQSGPPSPAWDTPPRRPSAATAPTLAVDGFEGPLDWLLELARAGKVDLARLSILALVEAFAGALETGLRRTPGAPAPDLARWADWMVMAAQLAELRSRLLRPADAPEARTAQAEAEALRRQWLRRAEMAAADWLERRHQLGRDVFARGQPEAGWAGKGVGLAGWQAVDAPDDGFSESAGAFAGGADDTPPVAGGDLTDLLRACLVALRLPPYVEAYRPQRLPFWGAGAAAARITRLLQERPQGRELGVFLPKIAETGSGRALQCRAALAATFVAGLELARGGALTLHQDVPWQPVRLSSPVRCAPP